MILSVHLRKNDPLTKNIYNIHNEIQYTQKNH